MKTSSHSSAPLKNLTSAHPALTNTAAKNAQPHISGTPTSNTFKTPKTPTLKNVMNLPMTPALLIPFHLTETNPQSHGGGKPPPIPLLMSTAKIKHYYKKQTLLKNLKHYQKMKHYLCPLQNPNITAISQHYRTLSYIYPTPTVYLALTRYNFPKNK